MRHHWYITFFIYELLSDVTVTALTTFNQSSHCNRPSSSARCAHIQCDEDKNYYFFLGYDGLGSQFFNRLTVKAYCANPQHRCVYVHQPVVKAEHNYRGDPNFGEVAEQLLNIHHSSPLVSEMAPSCKLQDKENIIPNKTFFTPEVLNDFRAGYRYPVNSRERLTSASNFNCVTYLRRGDKGPPAGGRLTNQEAIDIMTKVNASYPNCTFYVFSQGEWGHRPKTKDGLGLDYSDWLDADRQELMRPASLGFAEISQLAPGVKLILDADVWAVFDAMVTADVLVLDASSFPKLAALFNPNVVIYNAIETSRLANPYLTCSLDHWKLV